MKVTNLILIIFIFLSGCTFRKGGARNEVASGHFQLYTHPTNTEVEDDKQFKRIVIVGTNDLYGHISTQFEPTLSQKANKEFEFPVGGLSYFSSYIKILREKYKNQV